MQNIPARIRIKKSYSTFSKKERAIADYILNNEKEVSRISISTLASKLNIADSTLFQFSKKIGYSGFSDLKVALLTDKFDISTSVHNDITKNDSAKVIASKVFDSSIKALSDTKTLISDEIYSKVADYMIKSSNVFFFGLGGSNAVAYDSYHKFLRTPINCKYVEDYHLQLMNANLLTKHDCAFIISHTGIDSDCISIAKMVKKNGAKLIVLTSSPLSPLAKMADATLISTSEELAYRSESLSSRISQLVIIDSLYVLIMFKDEKKSKTSLTKIREAIAVTRD